MYWLVRKNKDGTVNIMDTMDLEIDTLTMDELAYYLDKGVEVIGARRNRFMGNKISIVQKKLYMLINIDKNLNKGLIVSIDGSEQTNIKLRQVGNTRTFVPMDDEGSCLLEDLINENLLINAWDKIDYLTPYITGHEYSSYFKELYSKKGRSLQNFMQNTRGVSDTIRINGEKYRLLSGEDYLNRGITRVFNTILKDCKELEKFCKEDLNYDRYIVLVGQSDSYGVVVYDTEDGACIKFDRADVFQEMYNGYGFRGLSFDEFKYFEYTGNYDIVLDDFRKDKKVAVLENGKRVKSLIADGKPYEPRYKYLGVNKSKLMFSYYNPEADREIEKPIDADNLVSIEDFGNDIYKFTSDIDSTLSFLSAREKLTGKSTQFKRGSLLGYKKNLIRRTLGDFIYSDDKQSIWFNNLRINTIDSANITKNNITLEDVSGSSMGHDEPIRISLYANGVKFDIFLSNENIDWVDDKTPSFGAYKPNYLFSMKNYMVDYIDLPVSYSERSYDEYIRYSDMEFRKHYSIPVPDFNKSYIFNNDNYIVRLARLFDDYGAMLMSIVGVEITGFHIDFIGVYLYMEVVHVEIMENVTIPFIKKCELYTDYVDKDKLNCIENYSNDIPYISTTAGCMNISVPKVLWEV